MTRLLIIAALFLVAFPVTANDIETYGAGVEITEPTPILEILAEPDRFLGKTVRIEGKVLDVCPAKGCWIEVGGEDGKSLQVKVEDDVIVFPAAAKGKVAAAQGVVEAVDMTRDRYLAYLAHLAEEKGEDFDPETADIGDGPYRLIRLRGTGAVVE